MKRETDRMKAGIQINGSYYMTHYDSLRNRLQKIEIFSGRKAIAISLYLFVFQNEGEPPKKKLSPSSSSVKEMKTIEPEDDSDSSSSSSSGSPVRMIDDVEWKTNQSFFKNEDEESSEEVKSLTEEEIEEVDIFLGELEYFQNFFNLNEYDKRAG